LGSGVFWGFFDLWGIETKKQYKSDTGNQKLETNPKLASPRGGIGVPAGA
jgi:hypothetical protein